MEKLFLSDLFAQRNRNPFHCESETGFDKSITARVRDYEYTSPKCDSTMWSDWIAALLLLTLYT